VPIPSLKEQFAALIAAPSVSCTQPGWDQSNRPVIELLAAWLGELGFACETPEVAPGKFNLLASYGSGPGGLVLAGHSDTVPFDGELWTADPLRLREADDRWYGLGSCDMKGFFALIIEAVRPLLEQPFRRPLLILATCDEESSMSGARALAAAGQPLGRAALIGEPTGLRPVRLHKGIMMERIDILGQSGHSSNPAYGHSALEAMHGVIGEMMTLRRQWQAEYDNPLFDVPKPTLNFGCIHGGDNPNRICGQCALEFDLRPLPGMDPQQLRWDHSPAPAAAGRAAPGEDRPGPAVPGGATLRTAGRKRAGAPGRAPHRAPCRGGGVCHRSALSSAARLRDPGARPRRHRLRAPARRVPAARAHRTDRAAAASDD